MCMKWYHDIYTFLWYLTTLVNSIAVNKSQEYGIDCILGITEVWGSQPKNIIQKPASQFLFDSLAVLVRHSQAQKMSSDKTLNPFQQVVVKFPI